MDALLGRNPSYIWRSLFWNWNILRDGLFRKVGIGESIQVLVDRWILSFWDPISLLNSYSLHVTKVKELVLNGAWNIDLIFSMFLRYIANDRNLLMRGIGNLISKEIFCSRRIQTCNWSLRFTYQLLCSVPIPVVEVSVVT